MSSIKIKQENEKEIIALTQFEAVRHRPGMYVGSILPNEEKIPLIIDNKLQSVEKNWSMGLMQTFIEIFENGLDEAKRCKGSMKKIHVTLNLDDNKVTVRDEGNGFYKAHEIHSKTKKTIVRTALEELHAGSNFGDNSSNILGTHGVGASCVNVLSEVFEVSTTNDTHKVDYTWNDFKVVKQKITEIDKVKNPVKGTSISFIPSKEVFNNQKWDMNIISTYLSFKQMLIKNDPVINELKINASYVINGIKNDLKIFEEFIPNHIKVETKLGTFFLWFKYENSTSVSFVNGSSCSGIHQKIVNDWINEFFDYNLAHHFYDTMFILNVPSKLMRFADQNKTRYAVTRAEIESHIESSFKKKILSALNKSDIAGAVKDEIEKRLHADNLKKIKSAQKQSKRKISDKYISPSKKKENLYITEGLSAMGGLSQARNSESDGLYALRGKIKNTRHLSDLTKNQEILDLMSILGIDPGSKKIADFDKIVLAADPDPDGIGHICPLCINFFFKWFPQVIENKQLFVLSLPLLVCTYNKERKYFYSSAEFNKFIEKNKVQNITYLKGLGSLSVEDWKFVMQNRVLFQISNDSKSSKYLDIAFGESTQKRKKWLASDMI